MRETTAIFIEEFKLMQKEAYRINERNGWWSWDRNDGELIALMHSELSEALEGLRHKNPLSDKIPEFSSAEEEFADLIIRVMDMAEARDFDVANAIVAKLRYNEGRPYKHGKEF